MTALHRRPGRLRPWRGGLLVVLASAIPLWTSVALSGRGATQDSAPQVVADATRPVVVTATDALTVSLAAIDDVLTRYREAFNSLDARAAKAVWPSVNERSLARAFAQIRTQDLTFADCQTSLETETAARVTCRGSVRYLPRLGPQTDRLELRRWTFRLVRVGTDWRIRGVESVSG